MNILIGASSAIAQSFRDLLLEQGESVVCISRSSTDISHPNLQSFICDYSEEEVNNLIADLAHRQEPIHRIGIFMGVLHNSDFMPEKKLEDWSMSRFYHTYYVNVALPMMWISKLTPILTSKRQTSLSRVSLAALSARVGSIDDNQLGGWYSYRSSKSALNMNLKTTAIEMARRASNTKVIAFHPGTTDSELSKPFQSNVSDDKLFYPHFVANRLLTVMDTAPVNGRLSYLDWDNKPIKW